MPKITADIEYTVGDEDFVETATIEYYVERNPPNCAVPWDHWGWEIIDVHPGYLFEILTEDEIIKIVKRKLEND